ncbi:hypothetical protein Fcan01_15811 [Folsomia candida]|uniref:Uncharacterized protein n=1 Tax=Folsomia candida TaxID=158441 RepID=A0A226DWQ8_FOLCA|nr:hypothetical protein Fcan01_15811 [Folsomia candida]
MPGVVPISTYLIFPYVAGVLGVIVTQIVDIAAKTYQSFDTGLNLMKGKCSARTSIMYRRLIASPVMGCHVYLGGRLYPVKKNFKIEYRATVLYYTVSLMLAIPVDSFRS